MSVPNKFSPETNVQPPRCPHCGSDIGETIGTYEWTQQNAAGLSFILAVYCPNLECRKVLHTQILIIPKAQEQRNIVGPH